MDGTGSQAMGNDALYRVTSENVCIEKSNSHPWPCNTCYCHAPSGRCWTRYSTDTSDRWQWWESSSQVQPKWTRRIPPNVTLTQCERIKGAKTVFIQTLMLSIYGYLHLGRSEYLSLCELINYCIWVQWLLLSFMYFRCVKREHPLMEDCLPTMRLVR